MSSSGRTAAPLAYALRIGSTFSRRVLCPSTKIRPQCLNLGPYLPPLAVLISQKCVKGVYSGVKTTELDALAAETAAYLTTDHPDYSILAARIAVSNLHKQTMKVISGPDCLLCP